MQNKKCNAFKCVIIGLFILLQLIVISNFVTTTELIRNDSFINESKYTDVITINEDSFTISNCYKLNRYEQIEVIKIAIKDKDTNRTINNMEAELIFHIRMYKLDILTNHSKDATIEFDEDERWYVRTITIIYEMLGI